jgi:hypothetical protein
MGKALQAFELAVGSGAWAGAEFMSSSGTLASAAAENAILRRPKSTKLSVSIVGV